MQGEKKGLEGDQEEQIECGERQRYYEKGLNNEMDEQEKKTEEYYEKSQVKKGMMKKKTR